MQVRSGSLRPRPRAIAALVVACLFAAPGASQATTMHPFTPSELTWVSDLVAEAVVEASSTERTEGSLFLRTVTDLRLVQVLKGDLIEGDVVTLPLLGGKLGGEETTVPSEARFTPGERVLVFLERWEQGWRAVGMSQGAWTLVEEPGSGRDVLVQVQRDYGLASFDERLVQLPPPSLRTYADAYVEQIQQEVADDFVPAYEPIPGLPAPKDRRFKKAALAAGQSVDPRAFAPGELERTQRELREENR